MSEYERLTARSKKNNMAYLVNVKENEQEVDSKYPNTLRCILDSFQRLAQYEDIGSPEELADLAKAKAEGKVRLIPCEVGDAVFSLCKCKEIHPKPDGTIYSYDGSPGTATGYYCPYDGDCPHDADDCKKVEGELAVFKDTVIGFSFYENESWVYLENTPNCEMSDFGKTVFTSKEEAEQALKQIGGGQDE